ncbi:hypothetical protein [Gracilimonas sp.]|uniref:hypothetical protein n=1 Tax=Gracilimonas sp. TaxID=1974203 RepID=UPI002870C30A|nr:hypothetical protein [Gracilimonas sp.]
MPLKYLAPAVILILAFWGCVEKQTTTPQEPQEIAIDTLYQFMDFESHGISRPGSITILPNGNIAVADGQIKKITFVTPEGDSVAQFGKEGRGPAEFIYPGNLTVASGLFNVVDGSQFKVIEFDYQGNYVDNFVYESNAVGGAIALSDNREYFTGASGEDNKLIKWAQADSDSSFLFGDAKISMVEDLDIEASRNDIVNGRIPDYMKNNVILALGDHHLYAFLNSYSELRKYDMNGNLIWEKKLELPDNEQLRKDIAEAAENMPNALPFLTYVSAIKVIESDIYLLGNRTREYPQHITKVNPDGEVTAFYRMPDGENQFMGFTVNPEDQTLYISDMLRGMVYKGTLE